MCRRAGQSVCVAFGIFNLSSLTAQTYLKCYVQPVLVGVQGLPGNSVLFGTVNQRGPLSRLRQQDKIERRNNTGSVVSCVSVLADDAILPLIQTRLRDAI